jgi:negative regulator of sigma E activity
MTEQIREQVSAFLDGELAADELSLLVRRMERDPELRRSYASYSLIGESLRAPGSRLASPGFAQRVSTSIGSDSQASDRKIPPAAQPAQVGRPPRRWQRPALAAGMAAGAALLAVLALQPDFRIATYAARPVGTPGGGGAPLALMATPTPAYNQRLAHYMVAHSEFSSPIVRNNVLTGLLASDPRITRVSLTQDEVP